MPLPIVLFAIFLVLKLTETIDWSWWWVTSPLWIAALIVLPFYLIFGSLFLKARKEFKK